MIPNFGLIMICAILAIGTGVVVALFNEKEKKDKEKKYIKKVIPACIGSSIAVTFVSYFRYPGLWDIGDLILNLLVTFVVTAIAVSICFWIVSRMKHK